MGPESRRGDRLRGPVPRHRRLRGGAHPRLGGLPVRARLRRIQRGRIAQLPTLSMLRLPRVSALHELEPVHLCVHGFSRGAVGRPVLLPRVSLCGHSRGLPQASS